MKKRCLKVSSSLSQMGIDMMQRCVKKGDLKRGSYEAFCIEKHALQYLQVPAEEDNKFCSVQNRIFKKRFPRQTWELSSL